MIYKAVPVALASAFLLCYGLFPFFERVARKKGFVTNQISQKADKRQVPYVGGTGIFIGFSVVSLIVYNVFKLPINSRYLSLFLFASFLVYLFGLYDDFKELRPAQKLIGQCIAAIVLVGFLMRTQIIYINGVSNVIVSLFWVVFMANAFNLLDIIDGLAGSISLINIFVFFLFAVFTGNHFVVLITVCLLGSLIAFLRYNLPPAKIFMGDSGSQFLGFSQAAIAIALSFARDGREVSLVIPLVILAIPIFDLLFVVFMRMRQGKSIFLKSNDHFVFKMLQFGISKDMILKIMIMLSIITNSCALIIFLVSNIAGTVVFILVITMLFAFGIKLSRLGLNQ